MIQNHQIRLSNFQPWLQPSPNGSWMPSWMRDWIDSSATSMRCRASYWGVYVNAYRYMLK